MKFFKKLLELFRRAKAISADIDLKVQTYIKEHSKQLKLLMTIYEGIFPAGTGLAKMACLVNVVCTALGLEEVSPQIIDYVTAELQKLYDKLKSELN